MNDLAYIESYLEYSLYFQLGKSDYRLADFFITIYTFSFNHIRNKDRMEYF